jgi:hypothetical protein
MLICNLWSPGGGPAIISSQHGDHYTPVTQSSLTLLLFVKSRSTNEQPRTYKRGESFAACSTGPHSNFNRCNMLGICIVQQFAAQQLG